MLIEIPPEEYSAVLDDAVADALAEVGVAQPPVDPFALAAALGIQVAEDITQAGRARYVRLRSHRGPTPQPTVLLRPEERLERTHWALAHEIGEHLAHRVFRRLRVDPREATSGARESVANHLAGRLLVPTTWIIEDGAACDWDLPELKSRYATASHELIARRMIDLPPPVIVTIFDKDRLYFRRSNIPGRVPPMAELEQDCRTVAHHEARAASGEQSPLKVQAWPVHEPDWKREILRTEVTVW